jgi:PTH1 family peptidyl-tRNA hydrolase
VAQVPATKPPAPARTPSSSLPFRRHGSVVDWLIVGLGNPGREYEGTRHNIGFAVVDLLAERWGIARAREKFRGRLREGRAGEGGPRVALLEPLTYMNDAGRSVGPARGSFRVALERVLVVHDEIDLPFGEVRSRVGGGIAGHNGLRSLRGELGDGGFARVRVGVGRPQSSDPEIVAAYVLSRFREAPEDVRALRERAADAVAALVTAEG